MHHWYVRDVLMSLQLAFEEGLCNMDDIGRALIKAGAQLCTKGRSRDGSTHLHLATQCQDAEAVARLLQAGFHVDHADHVSRGLDLSICTSWQCLNCVLDIPWNWQLVQLAAHEAQPVAGTDRLHHLAQHASHALWLLQ
jgi:hypothetical protein